jgi:hypothetical protein
MIESLQDACRARPASPKGLHAAIKNKMIFLHSFGKIPGS